MTLRDHHRPAATLLATLAVVVGLAACSSSDASGDPTTPAPVATDAVVTTTTPSVTTVPATTVPVTTTAPGATVAPAASEPAITDADLADLEQQLDEIDELLAGVDADLSQD